MYHSTSKENANAEFQHYYVCKMSLPAVQTESRRVSHRFVYSFDWFIENI